MAEPSFLGMQSDLSRMQNALSLHCSTYRGFLVAAQAYEWEHVAHQYLAVVTSLEAGMDAFVSACRTQQALERAGG